MNLTDFEKVLGRFAEDVNNAAKRELGSRKIGKNRSYGVASRSLQKSLTYSLKGGRVSFGSPLPYAAFIHWGVNGTRKNRNAPYSFKYENPSSKHVDSIVQWMKDKPVRLQAVGGGFIKKKGPRGGDRVRSAAFLIARSIKRKGIEGLRYYTVALESIVPQYREELGQALAQDLLRSLEFKSGNITIKPK
jgi:hypothetical protein